ncbi:hypothetical protein [Mycobacterium avium]|uniref:hypothetical protein n=1 Tax=Mycobacterium avium TaxID=1764 RepID=UPI001F257625|nr:hypothetical protein [Mycobacterium avium]
MAEHVWIIEIHQRLTLGGGSRHERGVEDTHPITARVKAIRLSSPQLAGDQSPS